MATSLLAAVLMAFIVPALGFAVLRRWGVGPSTPRAAAASYGSVSAVTFVTAMQFLEGQGVGRRPHGGGHGADGSPAVLMAVMLANMLRAPATATQARPAAARWRWGPGTPPVSLRGILHESFTDGAQLLLLGSGHRPDQRRGRQGRDAALHRRPVQGPAGLLPAGHGPDGGPQPARDLKGVSPVLLAYAVLAPVVHATLALGLATLGGMTAGDAAILMVLSASAVHRRRRCCATPSPRPMALYVGLSPGVTFPLNIPLGIPVYASAWRGPCLG